MKLQGQILSGELQAIGAKAHAHRVLIASALSNSSVKIYGLTLSEDVLATINCLKNLGVTIKEENGYYLIGEKRYLEEAYINVKESGTTFRLLLPVLTHFASRVYVKGEGRLPERPIKELLEALKLGGLAFSREKLPFTVEGKLHSGEYFLVGDVSSQYFSGLLLASPLVSELSLSATTQIESEKYIDLTEDVLETFGVTVEKKESTYLVKNARYQGVEAITIEGDWSNAAPWFALAALGGQGIKLRGLSLNSKQGDKEILKLLKAFGANVTVLDEAILVTAGKRRPIMVDMAQIPDLLPVLAILSCGALGKSVFYNAKRLKFKETNRLESVKALIFSLGGEAEIKEDSLIVYGKGYLLGGTFDASGDHRLVMAAIVALGIIKKDLMLLGEGAINKSYPNFFEDFLTLGGEISEF